MQIGGEDKNSEKTNIKPLMGSLGLDTVNDGRQNLDPSPRAQRSMCSDELGTQPANYLPSGHSTGLADFDASLGFT